MELDLTIKQIHKGLVNKEFSALDLTKAYLDRIKKRDKDVSSLMSINDQEAIEHAKKIDKDIALGKKIPLLAGIPLLVKDNILVKGMKTTCSSKMLENYIAPYDATCIKRLKEQGAIILGKTNMDAFAHGSSTETSDFFKTTNPWDTNRVPGGSSGGSAAAVAANMCIFAIGSETAGSIRGPAVWCGVTGLKPTYGRVSRYGVVAMASSTDSPGPITKNALDAALLLEVIAGKDDFDATTTNKPTDNYFNLNKTNIKGLKIGKPKSYFDMQIEKGVLDATEKALNEFEKMGAEIVEIDLLDPKYSIGVYTILQRSEVSSNLARFDGIRYGNGRTSFGQEAKKRMMLGNYTLSAGYYDDYYIKAQKVRSLIVKDFNKAFKKIDVILGPTMPCVAPKLGASEQSALFGEIMDALAEPSSIAGLCAISVPCGFSNNLPVGFQLIGEKLDEKEILSVAHIYQQNTSFHKQFADLEKR